MSKEKTDKPPVTSYEMMAKEAQKAGTVEQLTYPFYQWDEVGQVLIGKVLSVETVKSDTYEGDFFRYIMDTDEGEVAVVLGAVADKVMSEGQLNNKIVMITWHGKKTGKQEQSFNLFTVEVIIH